MKKFSHKVAYIAGGIILGIVFSTTSGAFADQVKSLVGKKVTGEFTIVVDGKKLSDKGAVIDSKANVPARALSESLGAEVKVEGKTIIVTSSIKDNTPVLGANDASEQLPVSSTNMYIGYTKSSLQELRDSKVNNVINPLKKARETTAVALEELKSTGNETAAKISEQRLSEYDADISKYEAELKLIDEALKLADQ